MSIFDSRLFFLCPSLLFVLNTVLCATPFVVFIFLCLHTNWTLLSATLSFLFSLTSDRFVVVLPASVSCLPCGGSGVTFRHRTTQPRALYCPMVKKKPLTKNRGLVIYSHKYSELRELRDSSTQSYSTPTTKQKRPFSTLCVGSPKRTETKCSTWKNP